jgi:hypothetical protein
MIAGFISAQQFGLKELTLAKRKTARQRQRLFTKLDWLSGQR